MKWKRMRTTLNQTQGSYLHSLLRFQWIQRTEPLHQEFLKELGVTSLELVTYTHLKNGRAK
jgi:hypothetical protein